MVARQDANAFRESLSSRSSGDESGNHEIRNGFPEFLSSRSSLPLHDGEELFLSILRLLNGRRGAANALTLDEITLQAGIPNRRLTEQILEHRLADFPFPMVSSGAGYFIPATAEELNAYQASLRSRALKCFLRARTVRRKALAAGWRREGTRFANPPVQMDLWDVTEAGRQETGDRMRREV
jgi:hypothetical protein